MKPQAQFDDGMEKVNKFIKELTHQYKIKVGIMGSKSNRAGEQDNASIGALHEYGSFSKGVPARSWLRMPISQKGKEIIKTGTRDAYTLISKGKMKTLMQRIGASAVDVIQEAFETGGFGQWKKNAPMTVRLKGSSAPLIDTGQLKRSVTSKVEDK